VGWVEYFTRPNNRARRWECWVSPRARPNLRDSASTALRLDDFGHGHAELVLDQHHLAAGDQAVVDIDVDGLADLAVELEHRAGAELEQLADLHARAPEHRRHLHRHVEHR